MTRVMLHCLTVLGVATSVSADEGTEAVRFNEHIRPILTDMCFECHGPDAEKREADLRLDVSGAAVSAKTIVPGDPLQSELFRRVTSNDPDVRMPPPDTGKTVSPEQIDLLRRWIQDGAKYEGHWAFQPIRNQTPPDVGDTDLSDIDRFIVASMKKQGLTLSRRVSRQQLIRRVTFDLTGLPPEWSDVEAFINDTDPRAFEAVIDRLLESPRYGERWGRHWLDVARYADTHGGSAIGFVRFPFSYTYRDYVINAFNADLPYDEFILQQIAADQLTNDASDPSHAALGFLTVGRQFRNRHDRIDDQIDVISRGLLGLTVACARCHDHKFDAIPTTDYYSLHAVLSSSDIPEKLPVIGRPPLTEAFTKYSRELERRETLRDDVTRDQVDVMRGRLRMQIGLYLRELAKGTPEVDTSTAFLSFRTDDLRPIILERWRKYLAQQPASDPVFGPWHRLSQLEAEDFAEHCRELIEAMIKENGDPQKFAAEQRLDQQPPKWNPRVLEALAAAEPKSFVDVADVYGKVFAGVHRRWLTALLDASLEASPEGSVVPDEDARHKTINSSIERQLRHHLYAPGTPTAVELTTESSRRLLNRTVRDKINGTQKAIHNLNLTPGAPPRAMALNETSEPEESFVLVRGNPINRGERVEPRFLTAVSGTDAKLFPPGERRLHLARAIVDPTNPLTRRVIVNWVWQHHFGKGLVRTPDDFGTRGDPPTHPRLLDFLAEHLLADGWSLKKLHRRIMLSAVYQQAAIENKDARAIDPDNRLLWRMPRRRLAMEAMRDAMLAVSGELQFKSGGQPFEEKSGKTIPRRSVYAFVNRDVVSRLATTFDGANPTSCTVKRPETTVPQQTLFALNSEFIHNRAKALAALPTVKSAENDEARVNAIYQRVYSRHPEPDEITLALDYIQSQADKPESWSRLVHVLLAANEFHFVD